MKQNSELRLLESVPIWMVLERDEKNKQNKHGFEKPSGDTSVGVCKPDYT